MGAPKDPEKNKLWIINRTKAQKGKKRTNDTKIKIALSLTGRKLSETHRQALSNSHKGQKPWNKGQHLSIAIKQKLSMSQSGKILSKNTRDKISKSLKLALSTPEIKKKMTEHNKRQHLINPNFGTKNKHWKLKKRRINEPITEKAKKNMSFSRCKYLQGHHGKYNNNKTTEIPVKEELIKNNISFEQTKHLQGLTKHFVVDFVIKGTNIIVETDGCFFHPCSICKIKNTVEIIQKQKNKDAFKTQDLTDAGYIVLRFWEHDIQKNLQKCIDIIKSVILWNFLETEIHSDQILSISTEIKTPINA